MTGGKQALYRHPAVAEAAAIGVADAELRKECLRLSAAGASNAP